MSSPAQVAANQANAQKSTGPRSLEGKRASSRNNFRHGLYASPASLRGKDRRAYIRILDLLTAKYQPSTPATNAAVEAIAILEFRLDRCAALENIYLAHRAKALRQTDASTAAVGAEAAQMLALYEDARGPNLLEKLWRQEARLRREIRKAYGELADAQKAGRRQSENTNPTPHQPNMSRLKALYHELYPEQAPVSVPRGAPCPCGSGQKYKRCCGQNAPPLLHGRAA